MKTLFQILIASSIFIILTGCPKPKPCEDMVCQNNGQCNDGKCQCPDGYEGEFCQTKKMNDIDIDINLNTVSGNAPLDIIATAVVKSGDISSYTWDFGDNSALVQDSTAPHRYNSAGTFTIKLTAKGKYNAEKTVTRTIVVNIASTPPSAKFSFSPMTNIVADKTSVNFTNLSTGTISSNQWDFGTQEKTSTSSSLSYIFDYEGIKTVNLTASGVLGSSKAMPQTFTVHAMNPGCYNYNDGSSQSTSKIKSLRSVGLKTGKLVVQNNYASVAKIEIYHSDEWLNGKYTPFGNYYWNVNASATTTFTLNSSTLTIGNDWGIKISFVNGAESCIRSVNSVASYSNGTFTIKTTDIYN